MRLNLGTNTFGWTADEATSFRILDAFVEAGGTLIDTADMYSMWVDGNEGGVSESIIGAWCASRRPSGLTVATKSGALPGVEGRSREATFAAVEGSLRRLGVERIDLFYHHHDDDAVSIAEQVEIAVDLIEQGKIKSLALSNYSPGRLNEFLAVSEGTPARPVAIQPQYNLLHRTEYEAHYGPLAAEHGLAVYPYYSLASGVLTGKYRSSADLEGRARAGMIGDTLTEQALHIVDVLVDIADTHGVEPATVALGWLLAKGVTAPIASVSDSVQLPALLAVETLELGADEVARLDGAS